MAIYNFFIPAELQFDLNTSTNYQRKNIDIVSFLLC